MAKMPAPAWEPQPGGCLPECQLEYRGATVNRVIPREKVSLLATSSQHSLRGDGEKGIIHSLVPREWNRQERAWDASRNSVSPG